MEIFGNIINIINTYIFKNCKQTADFLKVLIFQITLMASLLSNGAQGIDPPI